jgi:hypothetical protein
LDPLEKETEVPSNIEVNVIVLVAFASLLTVKFTGELGAPGSVGAPAVIVTRPGSEVVNEVFVFELSSNTWFVETYALENPE